MCICKLLSLWIPCRIAPSPWLTWGFAALDQLGMNIASCWSKSFAATWGVPELGDPHSWMVKKRKFQSKRDDELGYPHFRKAPLDSFLLVSYCSCVCRGRQCHVWWSNPELGGSVLIPPGWQCPPARNSWAWGHWGMVVICRDQNGIITILRVEIVLLTIHKKPAMFEVICNLIHDTKEYSHMIHHHQLYCYMTNIYI